MYQSIWSVNRSWTTSVTQLYNMSVLAHCVKVATLLHLLHAAQFLNMYLPSSVFLSLHHMIYFKTKYAWPLGGSSMDGFSAIKMTALGRPQFLVGTKGWLKGQCSNLADTLAEGVWWIDIMLFFKLQFSEVLVKWQRFFTFLASQQGKDGMEALEQRLELKQLQVEFFFFCSPGELKL